jgi:hypothetical protein
MSINQPEIEEPFRPGQIGIRHLLGAMTVAAVVVACCAARLRSLSPLQAIQVVGHWAIVAVIASIVVFRGSWKRRQHRAAAGDLLLRVARRPITGTGQTVVAFLLTTVVVLDGVLISFAVLPAPNVEFLWLILRNAYSLYWLFLGEGMLWGVCLNHWLADVYWLEFRKNGLLTHGAYFPWESVSRLGWSPAHPQNLVFLAGKRFHEMRMDPASRTAVSQMLDRLPCP